MPVGLFGKHRYFNSQNLNKPREEFLDLSNENDLKHFNDIINNSSIDYSSQYKDIYTDSNIEFLEVVKSH